jgi:2-keto-4-pentenoate hydratase
MSEAVKDSRIARGMAAQLRLRRTRLQAGERPIGWKVGFGSPAFMEKLRISAPLLGFLTDGALLASGATISVAGWTKPVAEPEVAIHIGRDVEPGADGDGVRAAIAAVGPAIELADLDAPPEDVEAILSGNIYQRHVLLGPSDASRAGARLDGLTARVRRNGEVVATLRDLEANTGAVLPIVGHVADLLGSLGGRLRAGELVICGSVVPPIFIEAEDREVAFELEPVGTVSVRFASAA